MSRSILIEIEPIILKYARYCSGYDLPGASKKLKITEDILRQLEDQRGEIPLTLVKRMSGVYKMPLAYFLLQQAPKDIVIPKDFRTVYSSPEEKFSPEVMLAIRRARYVQSIIQSLHNNEIKYTFKSVKINEDPEDIAAYFRSLLGVELPDQTKWYDPSTALRAWKESVERLGIFVLQQSLSKDDISAFCLADEKPYVLLLNSSEHENRRIFSLFHEIGHILLHRSGVCNPNNFSRNSFEYIQIEKFCNQFAASLLVPLLSFKENSIVKKLKTVAFEDWKTDDIKVLASAYRVSQEVIYRRLVQINVLTEKKYEEKRSELIKAFEEYKKVEKKDIIIPQHRKIISKNGRAFTSLVLQNMHDNRITMADVADFLGTTSRHISQVEASI